MHVTSKNLETIDDIYVHDSDFSSFFYDYKDRRLNLALTNHHLKQTISLCFNNVIYFNMQSCCFWGPSSMVYDMWSDPSPVFFQELQKKRETNYEEFYQSYLDRDCTYISIIIKIVSGDELQVTCESVDIECSENGSAVALRHAP